MPLKPEPYRKNLGSVYFDRFGPWVFAAAALAGFGWVMWGLLVAWTRVAYASLGMPSPL
ncbi:hypothetical protein [Mesorhizobium sp.]|uniref:hypothetical protein n=1 Tax=Mesorhizobium sp. TaxID=1871066 RepID=UPI0025E778D8|nr:hypothetical protein [Mesorhizobium sp.]